MKPDFGSALRAPWAVALVAVVMFGFGANAAVARSEVQSEPVATVRLSPESLGLESGAEQRVAFRFENVQDLYGMEVHLSFDPNLVEVIDADTGKDGVQIAAAGWLADAFVAANQADNAAGRIDFAATLLNPAPPVSGSHDFATITFRAKGSGEAPLRIDSALLATRDAQVIATQTQNGLVGVSASGGAQEPVPSSEGVGPAGSALTLVLIATVAIAVIGLMLALGVLAIVVFARRQPAR